MSDRRQGWRAALLLCAAGLVAVSRIWPSFTTTGTMFARDAGGHLLRAHYWVRELLPDGRFTGWFPLWYGGLDLYHVYPVLAYYLLGPLSLIVPPQLALRITAAGLWIALLPASYFVLTRLGARPVTAGLGASLMIVLNGELSVGYLSLYREGFLPNSLGFVMALLCLGTLKEALSAERVSLNRLILTGALIGGLVLSHPFCTYWWLAVSGVVLVVALSGAGGSSRAKVLGRYLLLIAAGSILSAFWWVGFLLNRDQLFHTEPFGSTPPIDLVVRLLSLRNTGGLVVAALSVLGVLVLVRGRRWATLGILGGGAGLSFLLSTSMLGSILPLADFVATSQRARFEGFYFWCIFALAAFAFESAWLDRMGFWLKGAGFVAVYVWLAALVIRMPGLYALPVPEDRARAVGAAGAYLDARLHPGEFILSDDGWGVDRTYGTPHFLNQYLPFSSSKIWDLSGNIREATRGAEIPGQLSQRMELEQSEAYLRSRGVRFVVTARREAAERVSSMPWLIRRWPAIAPSDPLAADLPTIFEVTDYRSRFGLPPDLAERITTVSYEPPGLYRVDFAAPVILPAGATLAPNYHPWLRLTMDGAALASAADRDNRLVVAQESSPGRRLEVRYTPPAIMSAAAILSGAGWLAVALTGLTSLVRLARRRRRA